MSTDRRRSHLTDADRDAIRASRDSARALASRFGVSRRLIQFIRNPSALVENRATHKAKGGWRAYYDKKKHAETMRRHRKNKSIDAKNHHVTPSMGITEDYT